MLTNAGIALVAFSERYRTADGQAALIYNLVHDKHLWFLSMQDNPSWTQSHQECLASLLNLIKRFGTLKLSNEAMFDDEEVFVVTLGSPGHSKMSTAYKEFRIRNKSTDKDEIIEVDCLSRVSRLNMKLVFHIFKGRFPLQTLC